MKIVTHFLSAMLCMLLIPLAGQAQFIPIPGHVYALINHKDNAGRCMEVGGGDRYTPNHSVNGWGYWGGAHQQWQFQDVGNGQYKIINRNSRQFLTSAGSSPNFVAKQTFEDNSGNFGDYNQRWNLVQSSAGGYKLMNGYSGHVLKETYIVCANCNGGKDDYYVDALPQNDNAQDFDFVDMSAATPGVFRIMNVNSDKALSAGEDNSVTQQPMWYLAGQEWTFSDNNSTGYISIINRNTNQVLEIGGGDWGQAGAYANVWDGYGHDWQQWQLVDPARNNLRVTVQEVFTTGIECQIINRYSGLALEIGGGGDLTRDGLAANQWYNWSGPNQKWHIYIDSNYRGTGPSAGTAASSLAASDLASGTLTLYPNPASTTLQLTLPGNRDAVQVTITDAQGRTVEMPHQQGKVDVSNLAPGLYIVSAADGQKTFRQKFVKE